MTPVLGVDVEVVDELAPVVAPTQTDPCFLIHTVSDDRLAGLHALTSAAQARDLLDGETAIIALTDSYFNEGGARLYLSTLDDVGSGSGSGSGSGDTALEDALERFQPEHGPGQLTAPECVTTGEQVVIAESGWTHNRVALLDCADAAADATLRASVAAVKASEGDGRYAFIGADTLIAPGIASGQSREIPQSIVVAALTARNDIQTGNPGLAAAGVQGVAQYVTGIKSERTAAQRAALAAEQVNTFRTYSGQVRNYGWLTAADLDVQPHWWDLSGARTIMAVRAREQAVAEAHLFGQIDGEGRFLDRYHGALVGELAQLQRVGAIYGTSDGPGYRVDVSSTVNTVEQLGQGFVTAAIAVKTSPHARALTVRITRRRLEQGV